MLRNIRNSLDLAEGDVMNYSIFSNVHNSWIRLASWASKINAACFKDTKELRPGLNKDVQLRSLCAL